MTLVLDLTFLPVHFPDHDHTSSALAFDQEGFFFLLCFFFFFLSKSYVWDLGQVYEFVLVKQGLLQQRVAVRKE